MKNSRAPSAGRANYFARLHGIGDDRELRLDELASTPVADDQVLWVDLQAPSREMREAIWSALRLPDAATEAWDEDPRMPAAENCGGHFWIRVLTAGGEPGGRLEGHVLAIVAGPNIVVTLHEHPIPFLHEQMERAESARHLGRLSAESFAASLLDLQLSTYFEAASSFESEVEQLEIAILGARPRSCLDELRRLRAWASQLRRLLASHRAVFGAISRPDFRPMQDGTAERHFGAIALRFERALDTVENARELVMGVFDLFSAQTSLRTDHTMRLLTFVTVVVGILAVFATWLGVFFSAGYFRSNEFALVVATAAALVFAGAALGIGRWRRWL